MVATATNDSIQSIRVENVIDIAAPIDLAWEALLEEVGPASALPDGTPMPMVLEAFPGGRWFRDLGNNSGHLWGHVQVIKPPKLLEITGPLFMSYAAANHIQYRLVQESLSTKLSFLHRGFGQLDPEQREGINKGWSEWAARVKKNAEKRFAK